MFDAVGPREGLRWPLFGPIELGMRAIGGWCLRHRWLTGLLALVVVLVFVGSFAGTKAKVVGTSS